MMLNIADVSDHSSSIASDQVPFGDFMDGVPGDEGMDMTESYQGDLYDYQACVYGPLDSTRGVPVRAAAIPAYVVLVRSSIQSNPMNFLERPSNMRMMVIGCTTHSEKVVLHDSWEVTSV